jgi:hypothetical protein
MSKKLSGLYPWLRFKGHTQEQWEEWYGLDTEFIEVKAGEAVESLAVNEIEAQLVRRGLIKPRSRKNP